MKDLEGKFTSQFEGVSVVGINEFYQMSTSGKDATAAEKVYAKDAAKVPADRHAH